MRDLAAGADHVECSSTTSLLGWTQQAVSLRVSSSWSGQAGSMSRQSLPQSFRKSGYPSKYDTRAPATENMLYGRPCPFASCAILTRPASSLNLVVSDQTRIPFKPNSLMRLRINLATMQEALRVKMLRDSELRLLICIPL